MSTMKSGFGTKAAEAPTTKHTNLCYFIYVFFLLFLFIFFFLYLSFSYSVLKTNLCTELSLKHFIPKNKTSVRKKIINEKNTHSIFHWFLMLKIKYQTKSKSTINGSNPIFFSCHNFLGIQTVATHKLSSWILSVNIDEFVFFLLIFTSDADFLYETIPFLAEINNFNTFDIVRLSAFTFSLFTLQPRTA